MSHPTVGVFSVALHRPRFHRSSRPSGRTYPSRPARFASGVRVKRPLSIEEVADRLRADAAFCEVATPASGLCVFVCEPEIPFQSDHGPCTIEVPGIVVLEARNDDVVLAVQPEQADSSGAAILLAAAAMRTLDPDDGIGPANLQVTDDASITEQPAVLSALAT